ncbi:MAG: SurA N-terminal domain-containing protein, partial [Deltaproteobacteria bacterium]|nr:SurA N-terminal domain-containing protein [Deltaproteobacteria bacterium]
MWRPGGSTWRGPAGVHSTGGAVASPATRFTCVWYFSARPWIIAYTCTVIAAAVLVCFPPAALAGQPEPVVARVNGVPLTPLAVKSEIEKLLPAASYHGSIATESWQRVVDRAIENAVQSELAYQEAVKRGIKIDKDLIDEREKASIARAGSEDVFEEALEANGLSREDFRGQAKKALLVEILHARVLKDIVAQAQVTDADLKTYYEDNTGKFIVPESVDVQHLLIQVPPWGSMEQWEQAKRRSEWIAKRA